MHVETLVVGPIEENCYVVSSDISRTAVVIDPGADSSYILQRIAEWKLDIQAILVTHGHPDHILALADLSSALPDAAIYFPPADLAMAFDPAAAIPGLLPVPRKPSLPLLPVQDGIELPLADTRWQCLATPGHTPGGVCWFLPEADILFTGDTLFAGSIGRTDFPGGDMHTLSASLRRLAELPGSPAVYPGHGPATTLDIERKTNPFLR